MEAEPSQPFKWQPVVMIVNSRIECECGILAAFISVDTSESSNHFDSIDAWCQDCFTRHMDEIAQGDDNE